jgi:endonuclease G
MTEPDQPIGVIGYPAWDSRNDSPVILNAFKNIFDVKRFSPGNIITPGKNTWYLTHDATTLGGSSGSAVVDMATQEVVGLHFGGNINKANYAVKASVIMSLLRQRSWVSNFPQHRGTMVNVVAESKRTAATMADRQGYLPDFLGASVLPPRPGKSHTILSTNTPKNLLPYTHFSILMSKDRRFPIFTAENLDGELKVKLKRKDSWGFDPRIPRDAQVGHEEFYGPELFDKGHMVRRENAGWGKTRDEAQIGEEDTFIFTNAIPQMPQLNQKSWLSLEDFVMDNARALGFKICVFTGPVFREDDPIYSGVKVPVDFWKVVVTNEADTGSLLTSAYLLSQEGLMPKEGFRYGPFKTFQVPLRHIEQLADLRFSKAVRESDVFDAEQILEMVSTGHYIEVISPDDIFLTRAQ